MKQFFTNNRTRQAGLWLLLIFAMISPQKVWAVAIIEYYGAQGGTYTINAYNIDNVKVGSNAYQETAYTMEGGTVTLTPTPNPGCEFVSFSVLDLDSGNEVYLTQNGNSYTFTLPSAYVKVTVKFNRPYSISSNAFQHGSFTSIKDNAGNDITSALAGTTVWVTTAADEGYHMYDLSATYLDEYWNRDTPIELSYDPQNHNRASFTMPEANVTLSASTEQHYYPFDSWAWADDGSEATVTFPCYNDYCGHSFSLNSTTTPAVVITPGATTATCTSAGTTTYNASVIYNGTTYNAPAKEVATNALGHAFDENGACTHTGCTAHQISYRVPTYNTNSEGAQDATKGIASWNESATTAAYPVPVSTTEQVTWGTAGQDTWYYVSGTDGSIAKGAVCAGNVHLILCDGAKLTVTVSTNNQAGICVSGDNNSLTIYAQSEGAGMGALSVTGGDYAAGIGGGNLGNGQNITINGGTVTATGGDDAAGIGGGYYGTGKYITINGGNVTANGGYEAAGIGGGDYHDGEYITINGGRVTANGGQYAAGIGGGKYSNSYDGGGIGLNITINGGTVKANGGGSAAGIGGGCDQSNYVPGPSSRIYISTTLTTKAGDSANPTTVISNNTPNTDLASSLSEYQYVTVHLHETGEPAWSWAEDGSQVTVTFPCSFGDDRVLNTSSTPAVSITSEVKTAATCTAMGTTTYTATVTVNGTEYTDSKDVQDIDATGHEFDANGVCTHSGCTAHQVSYRVPTYKTAGVPTSGIASWSTQTAIAMAVTSSTEQVIWGAAGTDTWYCVSGNYVTLSQGAVCDGAVHLILCDGASLTANGGNNQAGIRVSGDNNSLTIYAQSEGSSMGALTANGGQYGAGIGGGYADYSQNSGNGQNITIHGGTVTANGGEEAAGIGGGYADYSQNSGNGQNITINGGNVTATGRNSAAGIGGGRAYDSQNSGNCQNITINGGNVAAAGNSGTAGIGSGQYSGGSNCGNSSNVKISTDGWVKAGYSANPTDVVENTGDDLASTLNDYDHQYVTIHIHSYDANGICTHEGCGALNGYVLDKSRLVNWIGTYIDNRTEITQYTLHFVNSISQAQGSEQISLNSDETIKLYCQYTGGSTGADLYVAPTTAGKTIYAPADCSNMFSSPKLTSVTFDNFNTSLVTNMYGMFYRSYGLTSLDLSGFNTEHVTNMRSMFYCCSGLTSLDLSSFNTANVTDMSNMFACNSMQAPSASALTTIVVGSGFVTTAVTKSDYMFSDCSALVGGMGTAYNSGNVTATYAHYDGGTTNPGYFSPAPVTINKDFLEGALFALNNNSTSDFTLTFAYAAPSNATQGAALNSANTIYLYSNGNDYTVAPVASGAAIMAPANCDWLFGHLTHLTSLDLTNFNTTNVTTMQGLASGSTNLTSVTIGRSVTTIGLGAIYDCTNLTSISVAEGNSTYDSRDNCNAIIRTADNALIVGCKNTVIPSAVTSIGVAAFSGCTGLQSITIPSGVTSIGNWAFQGCSGLTSISIPSGVTSIGESAFDDCTGLTSMKVLATTPPTLGNNVFYNVTTSIPVKVPSASVSAYTNYNNTNQPWGGFTNFSTVPCLYYTFDGTNATVYGSQDNGNTRTPIALEDESTSIVIPSTVTSGGNTYTVTAIGNKAFLSNTTLTGISIPGTVTSIGNYAFEGCSNLANFTFQSHSSFPTIGQSAFNNCTSLPVENGLQYADVYLVGPTDLELTTAVIREGTMVIGYLASPSLTSVTIPSSVTTICANAFAGSSNISILVIPNTVTTIGRNAFQECTIVYNGSATYEQDNLNWGAANRITGLYTENGLTYTASDKVTLLSCATTATSVTIPNTVTTIMGNAFRGCTALTSVTFEDNSALTTIGTNAFFGCTGLFSITIPNTVATINANAFQGCTGLATIAIPDGVTTIGANAFEGIINVAYNGNYGSSNDKWGARYRNCYIEGDLLYTNNGKTNLVGCQRSATSVTIPNTVTSIGEYAFAGCTGLTSITIPYSVTNIHEYAFAGCTGLQSMKVLAVDRPFLGDNAFQGVTATIPVKVPSANQSAYTNYNNTNQPWGGFTNFEFMPCIYYVLDSDDNGYTASVRGSASGGFNAIALDNGNTSTNITIPSELTVTLNSTPTTVTVIKIEDNAFLNNTTLQSITIPSSMTRIGSNAFDGCTGLQSINIPSSVTSFGTNPFAGCTSLPVVGGLRYADSYLVGATDNTITSATIREGTRFIGAGAFNGCSGITSLTIPSSLTTIGNRAFNGCSGITSLTIGSGVTSIADGAFNGCSGLASISVESGNTIYDSRDNCNAIIKTANNTLIVGCKNTVIPNTVTSIGYWAFDGCTGLQSISIPASVTTINRYAFQNCSYLTRVTFGDNSQLNAIGQSVFNGCISLNSITIPSGVTYIDAYAFAGCSGLTSITIPTSVANIWGHAFDGCSGLQSISIPASVTGIGNEAFRGCSKLASVTFGEGSQLTTIGEYVFYDCTQLAGISIPDGVTVISEKAFQNCGLTSVSIGSGVTRIGNDAFNNCTGLTSVSIPASVTTIGSNAFKYCTGLTSVVVGSGVTSIGDEAFYECGGLKTVYNLSGLTITKGEYGYGAVAYNADRVIDGNVFTKTGTGANTLYQITNIDYHVVADAGSTETNIPESTIPTNFVYKVSGANPVQWKAKKIVLTDGQDAFNAPVDFTAENATYSRTVTGGNIVTFVLPAAVPVENINGKVWKFKTYAGDKFKFEEVTSETTEANVPYLVQLDESATELMTGNLSDVTINATATPELTGADGVSKHIGTYTKQTVASDATTSYYGFSQASQQFVKAKTGTLNPFRTMFSLSSSSAAPAKAYIDLQLGMDDDEADNIIMVDADAITGTGSPMYNLQGQRISKPVKGQIIIQNGKKVLY